MFASHAYDLRGINDAKPALRQDHEKFTAIGHKEKMIRRCHSQRMAIGQINLERFEWGGIPHFAQSFELHGTCILLT